MELILSDCVALADSPYSEVPLSIHSPPDWPSYWEERYCAAGFCCVPLRPNRKEPDHRAVQAVRGRIARCLATLRRGWRWKASTPCVAYALRNGFNIGLLCGPSKILVLDFDKPAAYEVFSQRNPGIALRTVVCRTGRGYHVYTRLRNRRVCGDAKLIYNGEVVGDTRSVGFAVMPPSIHPTGVLYEWLPGQGPGETDIVEIDSLQSLGISLGERDSYTSGRRSGTSDTPTRIRRSRCLNNSGNACASADRSQAAILMARL